MNLYYIGVMKQSGEGNCVVLAPTKDKAEETALKYFKGADEISFSKKIHHGAFIAASTFLDSDYES